MSGKVYHPSRLDPAESLRQCDEDGDISCKPRPGRKSRVMNATRPHGPDLHRCEKKKG